MLIRVGAVIAGAWVLSGVLGCVSMDTYRMKEKEVESLSGINEDMRVQNKSLLAEKAGLEARVVEMKKENEGLTYRAEKQSGQIVFLKSWTETLKKDGEGLRAQVERLNMRIAELDRENRRLEVLTLPENLIRTLGDRFVDLERQVRTLSGENEKLKSKRAGFMFEEKTPGGMEAGKMTEPAGARNQRLSILSQKNDGSELLKQGIEEELKAAPEGETPLDMP